MKDRSMEKKIALIVIHSVTFIWITYAVLSGNADTRRVEVVISFIGCYMLGAQFMVYKKTKYTFRIWLKIRKLNKQIKKLKKVADTNLKGKGRDMNYCNPVYTAREVLEAKQKEVKELVR